jgi:hypothetical protein
MSQLLDGPSLVSWLQERFDLGDHVLGFHARRVREWREGGAVSVFAADPVLTKLDLRPDELPEYLWIEAATESVRVLRVPHRLSDDHLRRLHGFHSDGVPVRELARRIWDRAGYASDDSAANAIRRGFNRLHLPIRTQPTAIRCKGTKSTYPSKGRRCIDFPMVGSEFCWAHHPARRAEVERSAESMREKLAAA